MTGKTTALGSYKKCYGNSLESKNLWQYHVSEQKLDIFLHWVWGVLYVRTGQELDKAGPIWPTSVKKALF